MVSDLRLPPPILPIPQTKCSLYNSQKIHPNVLCPVNKENSVYITNPCNVQKTFSYNAYSDSGPNILKSNRYYLNNQMYDRITNTLVNSPAVSSRNAYFKPVPQNRYLRNIVNHNKVIEEETKNRLRSSSVPPYCNYNMFGFDNSAFVTSQRNEIKRRDSPYMFKKTEPIIEQYLGHV